MSRVATDLTDRRFGFLVAKHRAASNGSNTRWHCECDCGRTKIIRTCSLVRGDTSSCGCAKGQLRAHTNAARRAGAKAASARRVTVEDALRQVAASWPASLARRAAEARRVRV